MPVGVVVGGDDSYQPYLRDGKEAIINRLKKGQALSTSLGFDVELVNASTVKHEEAKVQSVVQSFASKQLRQRTMLHTS